MTTFINPKTDFAFKKIFGSKKSKDILISFLNAILYEEKETILDVEIIDPYQAPRIKGMKDSYLDVKATIAGNKTVIIEMQVLNVLGFEKRVLYNAAKAFSIQLSVGEDYTLLNPVIALTITDFEMFPEQERIISRYRLKEKDDLTDYSDDIELVFVELPKFKRELDQLETLTDKWLYFLRSANKLQTAPPNLDEVPALHHAFEVAKQSKLSKKELELLEKREMFLHDNRNAILKARQDGRAEGHAEGRAEGEREKAIAIARSLLGLLDIETISQKTGIGIAEIQALL
ncbi:Rpn family recombination-promoting nuclease/putative transposase [Pseudanabaena sp. PCC 6802]|uniref:Rpn family recombination-promoting nuclease/putative transposase n=1 Tax=Pseudanabaena sp. PCC 6802 TaxID=118173 RepID=UPI000348B6F9|nr:Rpn family recombination-promoting nuclease/putative transposase [Pseudanabaena sp. PCC 6802]